MYITRTKFMATRNRQNKNKNTMSGETKKSSPSSSIAIGIDFGTVHTCISVLDPKTGDHEVLSTNQGKRIIPTMLSFTDHEVLFGEEAKAKLTTNPENTIFGLDRILGREFLDPALQADIHTGTWPFLVVDDGKNRPLIEVSYKREVRRFAVEDLYTFIFVSLKKIIDNAVGYKVTHNVTVISTPSYFNTHQKSVIMECARAADFDVFSVINNTAAATINHLKLSTDAKSVTKLEGLMVLNFGASGFDCSVVLLQEQVGEVLVTCMEPKLSGNNLDNILVNHFIEEFKSKCASTKGGGNDVGDVVRSRRAIARLQLACEKLKCKLSISSTASIEVDSLFRGLDFASLFTRGRLEELCAELFKLVPLTIHQAVEAAVKHNKDLLITKVVLVGGLSRIPKIQELVRDYFSTSTNTVICKGTNADECVAVGAAFHAATLAGVLSSEAHLLIRSTTSSFGIGGVGGKERIEVIRKNSNLPILGEAPIPTTALGSPGVESEWKIFENEDVIGSIKIDPTSSPLTVKFDMDAYEKLRVGVEEKTGSSLSVLTELKRPSFAEMTQTCEVVRRLEQDCLDEKKRMEITNTFESSICAIQKIVTSAVEDTVSTHDGKVYSHEEIRARMLKFKSEIIFCLSASAF